MNVYLVQNIFQKTQVNFRKHLGMLRTHLFMSRRNDLKITSSVNECLSCTKHFSENSTELQEILETILGSTDKQKLPIHLWLVDPHARVTHQDVHVDPRDPENKVEILTGYGGVHAHGVLEACLDDRDTRENDVEVLGPQLIRDPRDEVAVHPLLPFTEPNPLQFRETLEAEGF
jgi:hypothetical protein